MWPPAERPPMEMLEGFMFSVLAFAMICCLSSVLITWKEEEEMEGKGGGPISQHPNNHISQSGTGTRELDGRRCRLPLC